MEKFIIFFEMKIVSFFFFFEKLNFFYMYLKKYLYIYIDFLCAFQKNTFIYNDRHIQGFCL